MDDFISREAFIEQKRKLYCEDCSRRKDSKGKTVYEIGDATCRSCGIGDVLDDLDDFHAADVRPVVTCEECVWHVDDGCHNCTKLGMLCPDDADFYCKYGNRPNCGADMREES